MTRLVAIIIGLVVMVSIPGSTRSVAKVITLETFSIMPYNVRANPAEFGRRGYVSRSGRVSRVIAEEEATALCLQECWLPFVIPATWGKEVVGSSLLNLGGTPIYYSEDEARVSESGYIELPGEHRPFGDLEFFGFTPAVPRRCTWAKFEGQESEKPLCVFNVHLSSQDRVAREKSLELLIREIPIIAEGCHVAVVGDFNIRAGDESVARFKQELGLVDAYRALNPHSLGGTYQGFGEVEPLRIDYGLVCECYEIISAEVLEYEDYPSDHNPLLIKVKR